MDNLTHSLAGAVLGQMGLKQKTGLGMATLIIAANIPDIDALAALLDGHQHLAIRRGITHGPIAMLVLPIILTGIMIWFDHWQTKRGKRPEARLPVHKGWLLALAFIGTLSHPAMDWLNSYGVRLLEPFSSTWYYGDSIFIIDIWIWIALIAGVWISRRREKKSDGLWQRPAWISFTAVCAYIFANGLITGHSEALLKERIGEPARELGSSAPKPSLMVVANPVPIEFWKREMLWRDRGVHGEAYYHLFYGIADMHGPSPTRIDGTIKDQLSRQKSDAAAYLFWARMPIVREQGGTFFITDQRFVNPLLGDRFTVRVPVQNDGLDETPAPTKE